MKQVIFTMLAALLLPFAAKADDQIGGQWHEEAMLAWKEFNKGKELSEDDLKTMLLHGTQKDRDRFYALACDKGSGNYCFMAGFGNKNKKLAAKYHSRGCEIVQDVNNCTAAMNAFLDLGQMKEAKAAFTKVCNSDDAFCDFAAPGMKGYKSVRKMLVETCQEGHAFSCSLLDKYGVKYKAPTAAAAAELTAIKEAREEAEKTEKGWDGKYENAACGSLEECKAESDRIFKTAKLNVEHIPFSAKACSLGSAANCLGVGQYEEDRNNMAAAYTWYKRGCDAAPEAKGICLAAVDAKLKTNDLSVATALFLKTCGKDEDGYCEGQILGGCKKGDCFKSKTAGKLYQEMLAKGCKEGNKVSCKIFAKLSSALR